MSLRSQRCVPVSRSTPRVPASRYQELLRELPDWQIVDDHHLFRRYRFPNFATAFAAVQKIAEVAEAENHHPEIVLRWGEVEIRIWTHVVDGLTENDFILAAKCDAVVPSA